MKQQEHHFQVWTHNYLEWQKIFHFAVPNGGLRNVKVAKLLKDEGVKAGVSDLVLLFPHGETVFVELKVGKNDQQPSQKSFQEYVEKLGFTYLIWRTQKDVIDFVNGLRSLSKC